MLIYIYIYIIPLKVIFATKRNGHDIYIYIYIYIYNSPCVKKNGKWFEDENIQRITVKIYIGKKEKANPLIPIEKNQKTHNWLVKR